MYFTFEELAEFRSQGYIVKRKVLCPKLMQRTRDILWRGAPQGRCPEDPGSWVGPFREEEESTDRGNIRRGFRWLYREPAADPALLDLLPRNPVVWAVAEQLLGVGNVVEPKAVRGIYCTLPFGDFPVPEFIPHTDDIAMSLGTVGYIEDVVSGGGGVLVWPGSHQLYYEGFETGYGGKRTSEFPLIQKAVVTHIDPVELSGEAGDVIFWHHRLGHNMSGNRSAKIRQAVFYDFSRVDGEMLAQLPPSEDMWRDWPI